MAGASGRKLDTFFDVSMRYYGGRVCGAVVALTPLAELVESSHLFNF